MIYAGIDVNIITHEKALAAGVEALGLWTFGMCYAQLHETDGRLPRVVVLSALAGRRNIMLAQRLVEAGLWIANEDGSWSIWNYGKKNQTSEEIRRKKDAAAERTRRWRERHVTRHGTRDEHVRTDPSPSSPPEPSPSPSPENKTREAAPSSVTLSDGRPPWAEGAIATAEQSTGETFDHGIVWTKYVATRERDGRPPGQKDFVAFLASWASRQKSERVNARKSGAEITKQPYDPDAPWMKLPEVG